MSGRVTMKKTRIGPAPRMAPTNVPRPPTATQMAISMELAGVNSLGLMIPTCGT